MERTDEELLAAVRHEPEAFGVFYRRHVDGLLGYFVRRTRDAELAADLTAETFAAALDGLRRFDARRGPAVAWLYGIARHRLATALRRGAVEDRARRRLGMAPLVLAGLRSRMEGEQP
jgi:DNA-directed RNA polymerase specialized sigma24 family protein